MDFISIPYKLLKFNGIQRITIKNKQIKIKGIRYIKEIKEVKEIKGINEIN